MECPRCHGDEVDQELPRQCSPQLISGVVFTCGTCGLVERALATDRVAWYDLYNRWKSPELKNVSIESFLAQWTKKVGRSNYGDPEPVAPILPAVKG